MASAAGQSIVQCSMDNRISALFFPSIVPPERIREIGERKTS